MAVNQRNRSGWWIVGLLMLLVTGVALGSLHRMSQSGGQATDSAGEGTTSAAGGAARPPARSIVLEGERITLRPVQRSISAVGSFYGYDELTVTAEVTGRVAKVFHDVGDLVRPADALMELDTTDYALELEQTRRALELEVIRLGVKVPEEPLSPDEIGVLLRSFQTESLPLVKRARELERFAWVRLERAEQLAEANAMSKEEAQQRRSEYDLAKTALDQALFDAEAALAAIRHRAVLLRIAMRKLELSTIRVPTPTQREQMPAEVQYAVVSRKVTEGEMLKDAPGLSTATFDLVMDGVLKLEAQVPERYTAEVKAGQTAQIHVDAYAGRVFQGQVMRINPAVDRASRTFGVIIYVQNAARELKPGGFAEVEILTRVDPHAWTVSPESIATYAGSTRVFVLRDGKAHSILAAKGIEGPGWVELLPAGDGDLRVDDMVIRGGQDKLAEGVPVSLRNATELQSSLEPSPDPGP
ncbi:MAG: efflux RND transporter periplasmic adaptor subunit [Pirellulaceae bacterium]|jgi:multidrug resistance efflux pump|nr:efflux RND transporter periplasmic adaptor subunit [Pirellulaceae bacterium]